MRGIWRDHEKMTEGALSGLVVIQCNVDSVSSGRCFEWIDMALEKERGQPTG